MLVPLLIGKKEGGREEGGEKVFAPLGELQDAFQILSSVSVNEDTFLIPLSNCSVLPERGT